MPGLAVAVLALAATPWWAGDDADRASFSGGLTLIGLGGDEPGVETEAVASADLFVDLAFRSGSLIVYAEGNTTPHDEGFSLRVPESNADAATALDRHGKGRLQVSELKYSFSLRGERTIDAGLLDVTAYLDATRINNDENMQFLGVAFLNNPSIDFPDYSLGVVYHQDPSGRGPAVSVALTGSEGLADNADRSYRELVEIDAAGKGVFLGAEAGWQTRAQRYRLGAWIDTADHPELGSPSRHEDNGGVYLTVDHARKRHAGNIRLGAANEDVSGLSSFASVAYQRSWKRCVLGLGAARSWSSGELSGASPHTTQLEAYLRIELGGRVFLTPSVQYVRDSGLGLSDVDDRVPVMALRLRLQL